MKSLTSIEADVLAAKFRTENGMTLNEPVHIKTVLRRLNILTLRRQLDFQIQTLRNITPVAFEQTGEIIHEYARLHRTFGKGESACMAYCRFHNNVLGSSNLRDILTYCETNGITYLTTVDFLYYAVRRNIMTRQQADDFILQVNAKGSRLPVINWNTYVSQTIL